MNNIILTFGAINVTLNFIDVRSIYPKRTKNFSEHLLQDGTRIIDEAPNSKRHWVIDHNVPLTAQEALDLRTLCYTHQNITLTEDWVDMGTFNVHFRNLDERFDEANANTKFIMEFQEL